MAECPFLRNLWRVVEVMTLRVQAELEAAWTGSECKASEVDDAGGGFDSRCRHELFLRS